MQQQTIEINSHENIVLISPGSDVINPLEEIAKKQIQLKILEKQVKALKEDIDLSITNVVFRNTMDQGDYFVQTEEKLGAKTIDAVQFAQRFPEKFWELANVPIGKANKAVGEDSYTDLVTFEKSKTIYTIKHK